MLKACLSHFIPSCHIFSPNRMVFDKDSIFVTQFYSFNMNCVAIGSDSIPSSLYITVEKGLLPHLSFQNEFIQKFKEFYQTKIHLKGCYSAKNHFWGGFISVSFAYMYCGFPRNNCNTYLREEKRKNSLYYLHLKWTKRHISGIFSWPRNFICIHQMDITNHKRR